MLFQCIYMYVYFWPSSLYNRLACRAVRPKLLRIVTIPAGVPTVSKSSLVIKRRLVHRFGTFGRLRRLAKTMPQVG